MEILRLYRPERTRLHLVDVVSKKPVDSAEGVTKITGALGIGRQINLVVKTPCLLYFPDGMSLDKRGKPAEIFFEIWRRLKDAGLPVVNNVWLLSDEAVAMTDLTAKGGTTFDRNSLFDLMVGRREPSGEDELFMKIDPEKIHLEAEKISAKASESKIAISFDDPMSLVVCPNGDWKVFLLDIGGARFNFGEATANNDQATRRFESSLDGIRFGLTHKLY